jgi:hypothetical protein
MTRIALLLLTVGAFVYAVWLVLRGRPLPQPGGTRGLKRRFLLATLLFVGLLSQVSKGQSSAADPNLADPNTPSHVVAAEDVWVTIKTVWRTLDPNQAEVFRQHLETAVADGQVRQRVADILSTAFTQIAAHSEAARPHGLSPNCYTVPRSLSDYRPFSSEKALQEIEFLRGAQQAGIISESVSNGIHAVLAREIEMMWLLGRVKPDERMALDELWQRYRSTTPRLDSAAVAARIIVETEGGTLPSQTPLVRLQTMQGQVGDLLYAGPLFSDWQSRIASPSIESVLQGMQLVNPRRYVTCYRGLPPVTERTAELQELQAVLLQKCVDANVIDEQVAAWAVDPNGADPNTVDPHAVPLPLDFALEAEIRAYQKQIRCVMVELYTRGEVPSSFVRDVELAADIEILPVDANEARRRDMGYFLHALLDCPSREPFVKALEDRGLVPPAQNHRIVTYNYDSAYGADPNQDHVSQFISLLDSGADVTLDGDNWPIWLTSDLPSDDLEYRMTMRRACRILTQLGYTDTFWLAAVDEAIGIPVVGTIRQEPQGDPLPPPEK